MRSKRFSIVSAIAEEHLKFHPISTQLRREKARTVKLGVSRYSEMVAIVVIFNRRQFPKLDVSGSIPVFRSFDFNDLLRFLVRSTPQNGLLTG